MCGARITGPKGASRQARGVEDDTKGSGEVAEWACFGQKIQGVQAGAAGTLAEGAQPWCGFQAHCLLRERDHWWPFFPLSSVQLALALKWRTTLLHEQGH